MKRHRKRGPLVVVTDNDIFKLAAHRIELARYGRKPCLGNYTVNDLNVMEDILWGYLAPNGSIDLRKEKPKWSLSGSYYRSKCQYLQYLLQGGDWRNRRDSIPQGMLRGRHRKPFLLIGSRLREISQDLRATEPWHVLHDGSEVWARNGIQVPGYVIKTPERITLTRIMRTRNQEVRRVMLECVGHDNMIEKARQAGQIMYESSDQYGTLYVMNMGIELDDKGAARIFIATDRESSVASISTPPARWAAWSVGRMELSKWLPWFQENAPSLMERNRNHLASQLLAFVRVLNPKDQTGETREYFIAVPPWMTTASQAVAWSYAIPEADYVEQVRT